VAHLLRQLEDAGNSLGADAMKSPEFSKFMNQSIGFRGETPMRNHVKGADGRKHDIVLLSHDGVPPQAQMEVYGLADVF
jgi:hypothetical protein